MNLRRGGEVSRDSTGWGEGSSTLTTSRLAFPSEGEWRPSRGFSLINPRLGKLFEFLGYFLFRWLRGAGGGGGGLQKIQYRGSGRTILRLEDGGIRGVNPSGQTALVSHWSCHGAPRGVRVYPFQLTTEDLARANTAGGGEVCGVFCSGLLLSRCRKIFCAQWWRHAKGYNIPEIIKASNYYFPNSNYRSNTFFVLFFNAWLKRQIPIFTISHFFFLFLEMTRI